MDEPIRLAQSPSLAKLPLLQNTVFQTMPAGFRFGAHSHRNVELILVTRGSCTINVWKESIQLRPGEYMALLSSAVHTFTVCKEASCSFQSNPGFLPYMSVDHDPSRRKGNQHSQDH